MNENTVKTKRPGPRFADPEMMRAILDLKPGESLKVERGNWKLKMPPQKFTLRRRTGRDFKVETLIDDSGWLITAE